MKKLFFIAFMFIGMMSMAQKNISIDSVKAGDSIIIKKEITVIDITGSEWTLMPGISVIDDVFIYDGVVESVIFTISDGTSIYVQSSQFMYNNKRKVKFCR